MGLKNGIIYSNIRIVLHMKADTLGITSLFNAIKQKTNGLAIYI